MRDRREERVRCSSLRQLRLRLRGSRAHTAGKMHGEKRTADAQS
eukprot:SAG31_NODE_26060_length_449_cov_0.888571_1_plen_43_part_01